MAADRINWPNKILGKDLPEVPANKKLTFTEINQIRDTFNDHATEIDANAASIQANSAAIALRVQLSDIVNALDSDLTNKPLSAAQGKALKGMIDTINTLLTSDTTTLDTLQEVVDFIEQNKDDLDNLTISNIAGLSSALAAKASQSDFNTLQSTVNSNTAAIALRVQLSDIVNALDSDLTNKPLSAAQGKALKGMIDTINTLLTSDTTTLDTLQEVVDFIEQNKDDLDNLTISNIAGLSTALAAKVESSAFNTAMATKLTMLAGPTLTITDAVPVTTTELAAITNKVITRLYLEFED
jgi:uncharacterized protein Yka (UPF0111/DUF47 family)